MAFGFQVARVQSLFKGLVRWGRLVRDAELAARVEDDSRAGRKVEPRIKANMADFGQAYLGGAVAAMPRKAGGAEAETRSGVRHNIIECGERTYPDDTDDQRRGVERHPSVKQRSPK